jgi:T-complex protein 1 subunit gamma
MPRIPILILSSFIFRLLQTEKGVSDLASHYLLKAGVSAIRRVKKMENLRIARAVGATIVSRPDELTEDDVGTGCGLFEIRKIGEEYFMFLEKCKNPKACTIILRGGSRDILNEFERNLQDAIQVARQLAFEPKLLPGGGATEMSLSVALTEKAKTIEGVEAWPFRAVAAALEVIPRTLAQNCGSDVVRVMTELRAKKAGGANPNLGIDGTTGLIADMTEKAIWDTYAVRAQVLKSAVESACLLLRIDDILSGIKNKQFGDEKTRQPAEEGEGEGGAPGME